MTRMEDRLAHVRRLVEERWVAVEEMRRENEALRHRQQALVRHFQAEVLARRVASGLHMASVEKTVHADRQAVAHLEEELTRKQTANAKCRRHILRLRCLNDELARVRQEEEENVQLMRDEWDQDKAALEEIGRKDEEKRCKRAREHQHRLQQIQCRVDEVEAKIAVKKSEMAAGTRSLDRLQKRKQALEAEIDETRRLNESLRRKLETERSISQTVTIQQAETLEDRS